MDFPLKIFVSFRCPQAFGGGADAEAVEGDDFDVDSEDLDGELIDALLEVLGAGARFTSRGEIPWENPWISSEIL